MPKVIFRIKGLCCQSDVALIQKHLSDYVDPDDLSINLLEEKISIEMKRDNISKNKLLSLIQATGFDACHWDQKDNQTNSWFKTNRQLLLTTTAVIFWCLGLFLTLFYPTLSLYSLLTSRIACFCCVLVCMIFILPRAIIAIKQKEADIHLLMSIAAIGAMIIGQWMEAATVTMLFSIALLLETWSLDRARRAIKSLINLAPNKATVKTGKELSEKKVEEISLNETVFVEPGQKIPLDGVVTKGQTYVNESPITGESLPVEKICDSNIYAGTINGDNAIEFRVTKVAKDTMISRIINMVEDAQSRRARTQKWAEKFASVYTPIMILSSLLLALIPPLLLSEPFSPWIYQGLILLVVACPCALVISTPVSIVSGLNLAAKHGILIKGGNYLELPAKLNAIAFDKTGTLTKGKPSIQRIILSEGYQEKDVLLLAKSFSKQNKHPIAHAILEKTDSIHDLLEITDFKIIQGRGVEGVINNQKYWMGSHQWLHERLPEAETNIIHNQLVSLEDEGHTIIVLGNDADCMAIFSVADKLREESATSLQALKQQGIAHLVMLTGDNLGTAQAIKKTLCLDQVEANLLPEDKLNQIKSLKNKYGTVAIVGDGINDAPAMAESTLSIAMGSIGSSTALETADIVLMKDDLSKLPWLHLHAKRVLHIIKENIIFSLVIKAIFILLTLFGLTSLWMAIAADMGASLFVIFNGLRLLR
jgi:Cd2+/Zn2+-exporting ATPase